jgi:hypothetical protein
MNDLSGEQFFEEIITIVINSVLICRIFLPG